MSLSFPFSNRNPIFKIFICVWLCWVIIALLGLSLGSVSRGLLLLVLRGLLCSEKLLLLWSKGSVAMAHGLSCLVACGIVPDQGSNPCLLHWQVDSYPLHRQGRSRNSIKKKNPASPGSSSPFLAFPPLTEMEPRQICAPTTTAVTGHIPEMKTAS